MSWTLTIQRFLERGPMPPGERLPARLIDRAPDDALGWVERQLERGDLTEERLRRLQLLAAELWAREGDFEPLLTTLAEDWLTGDANPVGWLHALADAGHWHSVRTHLRLWERSPTDDEQQALDAIVERSRVQSEAAGAAVDAFVEQPCPTTWRALVQFVPITHRGPPGVFVVGEILKYGIPPRTVLSCLLEAGEPELAEQLVLSGAVDRDRTWDVPAAEA